MRKYILILILSLLLVSGFIYFKGKTDIRPVDENSYFSEFMKSEPDKNFYRAMKKREFKFPEDHGLHEGFQTEWWYFTGNLETEDKRKFGYQFTIFRSQLKPEKLKEERPSSFASNAVYMGHFTITDIKKEKFYFFEKFSRENKENTYVKKMPFALNLDGWQVFENDEDYSKLENLKLHVSHEGLGLSLKMEILKPFVLQGDEGLSQKSHGKGNASYYYSATRIMSSGTIEIKDEKFKVSGFSWLDREWSTSALSEDQEGWDWFSFHLDDGTDFMFYNLRFKNGEKDPLSKGVYVFKDGSSKKLGADDVEIIVEDLWESPRGGAYPSRWTIKIPDLDLVMEVKPFVKNQELDFFIRYYEGAVGIKGSYKGKKIKGRGYIEMTGYAE